MTVFCVLITAATSNILQAAEYNAFINVGVDVVPASLPNAFATSVPNGLEEAFASGFGNHTANAFAQEDRSVLGSLPHQLVISNTVDGTAIGAPGAPASSLASAQTLSTIRLGNFSGFALPGIAVQLTWDWGITVMANAPNEQAGAVVHWEVFLGGVHPANSFGSFTEVLFAPPNGSASQQNNSVLIPLTPLPASAGTNVVTPLFIQAWAIGFADSMVPLPPPRGLDPPGDFFDPLIPEPSALSCIALGGLMFARRRRRAR